MRYIEARTLIIAGLSMTCLSLFYMTGWTDQTGVNEIVSISIIQGFGSAWCSCRSPRWRS
jgi:DHA2 family multidrug resistance protein